MSEGLLRLLALGGVVAAVFLWLRLTYRLPPPELAPPEPAESPPPQEPPSEVGERFDVGELLRGAVAGLDRLRLAEPDRALIVRAPAALPTALREAVLALRTAWPGGETHVQATRYEDEVRLEAVQAPHDEADWTPLEPAVEAIFDRLGDLARAVKGGSPSRSRPPSLWYSLPLDRSTSPDPRCLSRFDDAVRGLPWPERYAVMLERVEWPHLRHDAFRYASWAERVGRYAARHGLRSALCPSVGLNVDPWLLAAAGLRVVAFDAAPAAIGAVAHPGRLPRLFSAAAKAAWEVAMACMYARGVNPHAFSGLPDLGSPDVLAALSPRVLGVRADWVRLPLADASVDVVYGCNALPREDDALRAAVLAAWARVLRPGGLVVARVHNAYGIVEEARALFAARGLREVDLREPDPPPPGPGGAFQVHGSSG